MATDSLIHERAWWGTAVNTWGEERKQQEYARLLGLGEFGQWPYFDLGGRSVVDIGGGPVSILLKTANGGDLTVVDPCEYPAWVVSRYAAHGVEYVQEPAEEFTSPPLRYDEAWIYNVLQHVEDPGRVVAAAKEAAWKVRIFEWTGIPADDMHPHVLTPDLLDGWSGVTGRRDVGVNCAWGEAPARSWSAAFETHTASAKGDA